MELYSDELFLGMETIEEDTSSDDFKLEEVSEKTIVPKTGAYLGLDISEESTGICLYYNGYKIVSNFSLKLGQESVFRETLLRRLLKKKILQFCFVKSFELIIIEDAYQGVNPATTRLLYALNTAIDELILDEEMSCKHFIRVSNKSWKSWLYKVDTENTTTGLNDKIKIQRCMKMLGVTEEGTGFQDRLDACGMLLGYFLCSEDIEKKEIQKKLKRVSISDVVCAYEEDTDLAIGSLGIGLEGVEKTLCSEKSWSKSKIIDYLTSNPNGVYVTESPILLGRVGGELGLGCIPEGGYFAFCIKPSRRGKYLENYEINQGGLDYDV